MISEEEKEIVVKMFCKYCKQALKHAQTDILRKQQHDRKREVLFSDMKEWELNRLTQPFDEINEKILIARGREVVVNHEELAKAIQHLNPQEQAIILFYYFAGWTDKQIAAELGCPRSTAQFRRARALEKLKIYLEGEQFIC